MKTKCLIGKTQPLKSFVDNYLLSAFQQDSEKYFANYMGIAQRVYKDLNFDVLTSDQKLIMPINQKLNTITLPSDVLYWNQISIIDDDNNVIPLLQNETKLLPYKNEIVPVACANPNCESDLCATVKAITSVVEIVTIDFPDPDTEYKNITMTQVLPDGSIIKKICKWYPVVTDFGLTISAVEEKCTTEQICKVELTEDECIADTPENVEIVKRCCDETPCCTIKKLLPTINILDGVVYFSNGNYDRAVLTYKTSGINFGMEVMVPEIAEEAMISGIAYYSLKHRRTASQSEKESARAYYNIDKNKLTSRLNPIREQEFNDASRIKQIIY